MIKDLITKNRSYRRFYQDVLVDRTILKDFVDLARLSASAGNMQPLKYMISCQADRNSAIFNTLRWAAYFKDWEGPGEGERPSAYIVILGDTSIGGFQQVDAGIACQSILLGAAEIGLGGCIIASINRDQLSRSLEIPEKYEILYVIALGKPLETVLIETAKGDIRYWRDDKDIHHVPKRPLEEIVLDYGN